jgi:hypothetical protein
MNKISEKGKQTIGFINQYFPKGQFTAKELSDACGEKVYAATLNSIAKYGFVTNLGGSPAKYEVTNDFQNLIVDMSRSEVSKGSDNTALNKAKRVKNDEFYTRYEDIEEEVMKYKQYFKDKIVYLPCDDPVGTNDLLVTNSSFWSFFVTNFNNFGLKKLIATHYDDKGGAYKIWIDRPADGSLISNDGEEALQVSLTGNGDFRSDECIDILKECDIVCTNPPFSMFRDFVHTLMMYDVDFLIIGNQNAFKYKEIFPLIKDGKIWTGYNMVKKFYQPDGTLKQFGNVCWFTNLPTTKRTEPMILTKEYSKNMNLYQKIDNYPGAINVNRLVDIPKDWTGLMGVPITYIDKHCPTQFEIVDCLVCPIVAGTEKYSRIIIQKV